MADNKKSTILIISELTSTYDFSFCIYKESEYTKELLEKIMAVN